MLEFVVAATVAFAAVSATSIDASIPRDIVASLQRLKEMKKSGEYFEIKKVCYPDVGCFSTDGPMKQTALLPFTPEKCGTKFFAYNPSDPSAQFQVDPKNKVSFNVVNNKKRLVIITHGFGNTHERPELQAIKNSLLKFHSDEVGTVIVTDWRNGAKQPDYLAASTNTELVGRQIAHLINELKTHHAVDPKHVYLIGFSLGCQVSGFAGKFTQSQYKFKIGRITGLDSAAPLFEDHPGSFLTKDDADFVDGIHTSAGNNLFMGEIGFTRPYAHVDFFPNSGHHQPFCKLLKFTCSHYASVNFYEASCSSKTCKFNASTCKNWNVFKAHQCSKNDQELGYNADKHLGRGSYYLSTTGEYPFCG